MADAVPRHNVHTKREVVDPALRRPAWPGLTKQDVDAVRGIGWEGDLDDLRRDEITSL